MSDWQDFALHLKWDVVTGKRNQFKVKGSVTISNLGNGGKEISAKLGLLPRYNASTN